MVRIRTASYASRAHSVIRERSQASKTDYTRDAYATVLTNGRSGERGF
jgi:hypothetical protein